MLTRYCILDLETVPSDDCRQWLGTIDAPKNYVKQDTIDAYIRDETERRLSTAGLDADLCKIVAVGIQPWNRDGNVRLILNEKDEKDSLKGVWSLINASCPMVGYGVSWFDIGVLVRRSQLLGVKVPDAVYKQGKYRHDLIVELADYLTLNGMIEQKKGRGLEYHCQRFGIHVEDACTGADVAGLWAAGDHQTVLHHCLADLNRIQRLSEYLGVTAPPVETHEPVVHDESLVL